LCLFLFDFTGFLLLPGLFGAAGAAFFGPSAAGCGGFFHLSTAGARLCASPASGMGTGRRDAAHAQKPGDSQAGKKFSQFLRFHRAPFHPLLCGKPIHKTNT